MLSKSIRARLLLVVVAALPVLVALVTATSCVSLEKGYPERRFFVLNAVDGADFADSAAPAGADDEASDPDPGNPLDPGALALDAPNEAVLKVRRFSISETFASAEFAYRTDASTWETDYYNTFLIPPAAQVADQARSVLDRAAVFAHVVDDGSYVEPTHLLEGHVVRLFADFRNREAPLAVLEMQLFLVARRGSGTRVVLQKRYEQEVPIDVGDYSDAVLGEGIVTGWNVALRRILTDFANEIRRVGIETPE